MRASRQYTGPGLCLAFTQEELRYLRKQPRFIAAAIGMEDSRDFERICELGDRLLAGAQKIAPPAESKQPPRWKLLKTSGATFRAPLGWTAHRSIGGQKRN
jgi:hypothetical protein